MVSIIVDDENYPAVLGKRGMNARLNGELIDAELQVQKVSEYQQIANIQRQQLALSTDKALDERLHIEGMSSLILESLISAGYDTPRKVLTATPEEIAKIPGISHDMAMKVLDDIYKKKGLKVG